MSVATQAKRWYERDLQQRLETQHASQFVAIEPSSQLYFIGPTFVDAALQAKKAHPNRTSFVIRIGRPAAFHIGANAS